MSDSRKNRKSPGEKPINKPRIFIVEDEIVIVRGLQDALERIGYSCCGFALSAEDAFHAIEDSAPDLALVDICLKGEMDGIQLAEAIRSSRCIPVIYITAYSGREILERAKCTDPFGYIVKPFRDRQLKVNIELALERLRVEREKKTFLENCLKTIEELENQLARRGEELSNAKAELQSAAKKLGVQQTKLDQLRQEMRELNKSLLSLTTHMARTRDELESEVAAAVRMKIVPILRQFRVDPSLSQYGIEFDMLSMSMNHLSAGLKKDANAASALSATELRVAVLIKNGLSSEQIADDLHVSLDTIKTHRRNIRKKLQLQNSNVNLSSYLKTLWAEGLN